jgi:UrcA family protein
MKQSILYALASALLTALVILAEPAKAEPADARTYVSHVQTADLDLQTDKGRRVFEQRLARAAREVCGSASDADLRGKKAVRECRAETIARASEQGERLLAAAKGGAPIAVIATR